MSDSDPTPDDLLVSAVLDGVASPNEAARVASDPRLTARLAQFRAVAAAVGGPVPLVDTSVREAHLARALAEVAPRAAVSASPPPPPAPPPPLAPTVAPPPVDLAAHRARRRGTGATTILSIAAAVILVVAVGAFLVKVGGSTGGSGDDTAASSSLATSEAANDAAAGGSAFVPDAATAPPGGADTTSSTITGAPSSSTESGIDPALPTVGTFTKAGDLADRVQGLLVIAPRPPDLATNESCTDDFGVDVTLLGKATVAGEEGLVYVESAPRADRRLWFVDPTTVDPAGACRQIDPVQTL